MTPTSISGLTGGQQMADAKANATPEQLKVARDFEAIFMRQLLSSMEKTGGIAGSGTGAGVYRSMMVGAIADSAAEGGGIGLSDMILEAMLRAQGVEAVGSPAPEAAAQAAPKLSQAGAAVVSESSRQLTPAGDLASPSAALNFIRDAEKGEASRGAPKGGADDARE
jgi:Rod binding domain-containing protein